MTKQVIARTLAIGESVDVAGPFSIHHVEDVEDHVIRPGESLWVLAQRTYGVPVWLLRQYNPDLDFSALRPGTGLLVPVVEHVDEAGTKAADCVC